MVSFNDVIELLKNQEVFRELVPELTNLVTIMLPLPASTCTAERSFSGSRHLKTYLRLGMKRQRLNFMRIMNVHKKETKVLSIVTFINDFVWSNFCSKKHFLLDQAVT